MRLKLEDIPELPSESHSFFLLPERCLVVDSRLQIAYREAGQGKSILLLHGLWTSAFTFRNLVGYLSPGYRVVMPELVDPQGIHLLPDLDYRPERLADLIVEIAYALGLEKPLVVAHAESGLAAMHLALTRPESMSGLVTVGMPIERSTRLRFRGWILGQRRFNERWAQKGFARPQQAAIEMLEYADATVVSRQEIRRLARHWTTLRGARATSFILAQTLSSAYQQIPLEALNQHLAAAGKFPVPLKLVYGDSDRRATVQQGQKLNRLIPGSELLVAEHSAGAVQVEKPKWTARIIEQAASG
jgi:pimeloyl-ACP methyl ester carboxylesterase